MRLDWKAGVGLVITVGLLWWLFRNEDPVAIWAAIREADLRLLALSIAITTGGFAFRAARWRWLLEPLLPGNRFRPRFAAVCVHFMVNNLAPARLGEFARVFAYARLEPVPASAVLGTLVVERFLDGLAVLAFLFLALASPDFPSGSLPPVIAAGIQWVSILLGVILAGFAVLLALPDPTLRIIDRVARMVLPKSVAEKFLGMVEAFVEGLASLRNPALLVRAVLWSLAFWSFHSLSFWVGLLAFGIELPYSAALFMNATIAFAVAVPAAPGFFGTFQAGVKIALVDVYGVALSPALGFAIAWHIGAFIPITLMGLWYSSRMGLSLKDIKAESDKEPEDSVDTAPPRS